MKFLLFFGLMTFNALSFGDVITVSGPTLNGKAVSLPNGTLQIMSPTMTINGDTYLLAANEEYVKVTDETGIVACSLINKSFVSASTKRNWPEKINFPRANFVGFRNGVMYNHLYDGTDYSSPIIVTLTCK